jgi:predicted transcriptional regulator
MGWSDPTSLPQKRGGRSSPSCRNRDHVLPAQEKGDSNSVRQDVIHNGRGGTEKSMAIIKAPPKQPKSVTIQARVEESVKTQLDQYAKFIDSTPSYVIAESLKVLFKRDDEFKAWLAKQGNHQNQEQIQGELLTKTA